MFGIDDACRTLPFQRRGCQVWGIADGGYKQTGDACGIGPEWKWCRERHLRPRIRFQPPGLRLALWSAAGGDLMFDLSRHSTSGLRFDAAPTPPVSLRDTVAALEAMLDHLSLGILHLDSDATILQANAAASALLDARSGLGDGIIRNRRRLCTETPAEGLALKAAVARACTHGERDAVLIARGSGRASLQVIVSPLYRHTQADRPTALVLVQDPARDCPHLADTLTRLYRLSRSEASLAVALAQGKEISEIAKQRSITRHTALTFLKRAMSKTGTFKQSALVRLVSSVPADYAGWIP